MPNGECSQCNSQLPITLKQNSVECPVCGLTNECVVEEKAKIEVKPKKSLLSVFISTVTFAIALFFIVHQKYNLDIVEFKISPVRGGISEITKNDIANFSEEGVNKTVTGFFTYLEKKKWLDNMSKQTGFTSSEIQECINIDYQFDIGNMPNKYWTLRFTCPKSEIILMSILGEFEKYKMILRSKVKIS